MDTAASAEGFEKGNRGDTVVRASGDLSRRDKNTPFIIA